MKANRQLFFFLFVFLPAMLCAQKNACDTTFLCGDYALCFRIMDKHGADSLLSAHLDELCEKINKPEDLRVIRDQDSIITMLQGQIGFHYETSRFDTTFHYLTAITCRNGLKLIFKEGLYLDGYYPDRDVIVINRRAYHLATGEDDYELERAVYLDGRKLRAISIKDEYSEYRQRLLIQQFNPRTKNYTTLLDLSAITDELYYYNSYLLHKKKFYLCYPDNNQWNEISLKKLKHRKVL